MMLFPSTTELKVTQFINHSCSLPIGVGIGIGGGERALLLLVLLFGPTTRLAGVAVYGGGDARVEQLLSKF